MNCDRLGPILLIAIITSGCGGTSSVSPSGPSTDVNRIVTIQGRVQDSLLRPIADARVTIVDGPLNGVSTTTNEEGRFALAASFRAAELTTVHIEKDGYWSATARWRPSGEIWVALRALALPDLEGQYTITFSAAAECSQLPSQVRSRTYFASISPRPDDRAYFTSTLTGAEFQHGYNTFFGAVGSNAARFSVYSWDAFNWWLEDQPIIERLPSGGYVAWMGTAMAPLVSSTASIVATLDGSVSYCAVPREPTMTNYPPTCSAVEECKSDHHQLVLKRR
jgi:Carboxypeptidase regulatory-like domain